MHYEQIREKFQKIADEREEAKLREALELAARQQAEQALERARQSAALQAETAKIIKSIPLEDIIKDSKVIADVDRLYESTGKHRPGAVWPIHKETDWESPDAYISRDPDSEDSAPEHNEVLPASLDQKSDIVVEPQHDAIAPKPEVKNRQKISFQQNWKINVALMGATALAGVAVLPSIESDGSSVSIEVPTKKTFCNASGPMYVEGRLSTFKLTDSDTCKRVLQAVPKPSENYTVYNKNISVRAKTDGSFEFRLLRFEQEKNIDTWLEYPKGQSIFGKDQVRAAYLDAYKTDLKITTDEATSDMRNADTYLKAETAKKLGKPYNSADIQLGETDGVGRILKFREAHAISSIVKSPITAKNYHGIVESWLVSGGSEKNPLPFSFFLAKWFLESGLGNDIHASASTACGINQFIKGTFITVIWNYGDKVGLGHLTKELKDISAKHGHRDDRKIVSDPQFNAFFKRECGNVFTSGTLGALNTTAKIRNMQAVFDSGRLQLPDGRTKLTEVDGYIGHFLDGNYDKVYKALAENPGQKMVDILPGDVYAANKNLFRDSHHHFTAREFYDNLSNQFGFSQKRVLQAQNWTGKNRIEPGSIKLDAAQDIGVKFRLVANDSTQNNMLTLQARPNVTWIKTQVRGVDVEAIPPTATAATSARMPS